MPLPRPLRVLVSSSMPSRSLPALTTIGAASGPHCRHPAQQQPHHTLGSPLLKPRPASVRGGHRVLARQERHHASTPAHAPPHGAIRRTAHGRQPQNHVLVARTHVRLCVARCRGSDDVRPPPRTRLYTPTSTPYIVLSTPPFLRMHCLAIALFSMSRRRPEVRTSTPSSSIPRRLPLV